jgi:hypothetical protein
MDCKGVVPDQRVWRVSEELLRYVREDGQVYVSGQLRVVAEALNFSGAQRVGLRYTVDDWRSWQEVDGVWSSHCAESGTDQFVIFSESTILPGSLIRYAIYCVVNGMTHWDNNQSTNYLASF